MQSNEASEPHKIVYKFGANAKIDTLPVAAV
ncbi:hypothetical protein PPIS_a6002 [Pseudoalteromonas piscicida]|uniref:Uncharacterized protein n=1 Tax=Pseudoalteromonas piscicida TaxID=43662 RepID=A0ABM6NHK9_PSEO7|nr:hypothetical protein PPIS_a6002 [Pseudoalteromonas piscicida]